ncbi:MAG: FAD-dependent monooxygenase [Burkholderiales bacterium]|nr:FAD-dependent monooxygenase [Burkholderiales bacterium]
MNEMASAFDADVIIVGGGPVGATLALALAQGAPSLKVVVLEAQADAAARRDTRTLALSHGSRLVLERVGIWRKLTAVTPITQIHISQRGSFGRALLSAEEAGLPALGYVIAYTELQHALHTALQQCGARYMTGAQVSEVIPGTAAAQIHFSHEGTNQTLTSRLVALADGGRSLQDIPGIVRESRDYHQAAVVCQVTTELPHNHLAYERFTEDGPAALLPSGEGYALVWTATPERAAQILTLSETEFLAQLHAHFGDRQGRFLQAGPRASFALSLRKSHPITRERLVLIGNAAQMLHPVAGQGFNMGLRDAWELSRQILLSAPEAIGGAAMLERYVAGRRADTQGGIFFTDLLVRGFSNRLQGLRQARGLALSVLDVLPPVKSFVVRRMIFGAKG